MLKRRSLLIGVLIVLIVFWFYKPSPYKSIDQLLADKGKPTFMVKGLNVSKRKKLKVLNLLVYPQDPETVKNWNAVREMIFVWAESEDGKLSARYFFDNRENNKSFDGGAWYSTRSLFYGERVTIVRVDKNGVLSAQESFRVDAFSMYLLGFVPNKTEQTGK